MTNNSAYGAASLNLLIAAKLQISVAKVSIPVGRNIKVAGSSFIAVRKTSRTPSAIFGRAIGKTTSRAILDLLLPKVAATSRNCGDTRANESAVDATDLARKRTAQAKASKKIDWYRAPNREPKDTSANPTTTPGRECAAKITFPDMAENALAPCVAKKASGKEIRRAKNAPSPATEIVESAAEIKSERATAPGFWKYRDNST